MAEIKPRYRFNTTLLLASGSPRRYELLNQMDIHVRQIKPDYSEVVDPAWPIMKTAQNLAESKWDQARPYLQPDEILLTADTVVIHQDKILHKPTDENQAKEFLTSLSHSTHVVTTGICIGDSNQRTSLTDVTDVEFSFLDIQDIEYYIEQYRPFDKAGAYGIQEWIGWTHIHRINGSFSNVMGLPTQKIHDWLKQHSK